MRMTIGSDRYKISLLEWTGMAGQRDGDTRHCQSQRCQADHEFSEARSQPHIGKHLAGHGYWIHVFLL